MNKRSRPSILNKITYAKQKKLGELGAIIRGTSYAGLSPWLQTTTKTKGASEVARKSRPGLSRERLSLENLVK